MSSSGLTLAVIAAITCAWSVPLHVIHTNDVHSQYVPITVYKKTGDFGGLARQAALVKSLRDKYAGEPTLVLDAGDQSQGSLLFYTWKNKVVSWAVGSVGYDAVTLGNHEFDSGTTVLHDLVAGINNLTRPCKVVCANVDFSKEPLMANATVLPWTAFSMSHQGAAFKVAVTGLISELTPVISSPSPLVSFSNPAQALKETLADIQSKGGADAVIVLSHLGYEVDMELAANTSGVSLIVGGHSHTMLWPTNSSSLLYPWQGPYPTVVSNSQGKSAIVVQAASLSPYVGEVTLNVAAGADRSPESYSGLVHLLDTTSPSEPNVAAQLNSTWLPPVAQFTATVIGQASVLLDAERERVRAMETTYGNLAADSLKDVVGAQIAILNGGALRISIPPGKVTAAQVLDSFPFSDYIDLVTMKGSSIWEALSHGTSLVAKPQGTSGNGRFPQVSSLRFVYDPALDFGHRILSVMYCKNNAVETCAPLQNDTFYKVAVSSYLRNGGDGYTQFKGKPYVESKFTSYEAMESYLKRHNPASPAVEGRILVCAAGTTNHDGNMTTSCVPCPAVPLSEVPAGSTGPCPHHSSESVSWVSVPLSLLITAAIALLATMA